MSRMVTAAHALGWLAQQAEAVGEPVRHPEVHTLFLYSQDGESTWVGPDGIEVKVVATARLAEHLRLPADQEQLLSSDGAGRCRSWSGCSGSWCGSR
ncbi:MAG: hypothetical protein FWD18_01635 [Micrococcales bacterium]|nr:hypothetical protein [Micrococcales bacterium]